MHVAGFGMCFLTIKIGILGSFCSVPAFILYSADFRAVLRHIESAIAPSWKKPKGKESVCGPNPVSRVWKYPGSCCVSRSTWSAEQHGIPTFQTDKPVTSVHQTLEHKNVSTLPH